MAPGYLAWIAPRRPALALGCICSLLKLTTLSLLPRSHLALHPLSHLTMPAPPEFLKYICDNQTSFVQRLSDAVAIKRCAHSTRLWSIGLDGCAHITHSVSGDASLRDEVIRMADYLKKQLTDVGCDVRAVPLGTQNLNGQDIELPPVLLGSIGNDPNKKTILTYGHFDVQPVR